MRYNDWVSHAPTLALVGGFLGAGKTTLILRAAELLRRDGLRTAIITNDQDAGLVDTGFAAEHDVGIREVAGGCFCCRFSGLLDAAGQLAAYRPGVIFAEPVGSCTDLSATVLQPLRAWHSGDYQLAPYTVLVDPARIPEASLEDAIGFLFRQQIAEADLLCLSKCDVRGPEARLPVPIDYRLSAVTGLGVREWLREILHPTRISGARVLDIDYTRYAEAEAALGWVNLHADLTLRTPASPAALAGPLLEEIDRRLTAAGIRIAHLKVFDRTATGYVKASVCANGDDPLPEGDLAASPAARHELVVNLRALGDPGQLRSAAGAALGAVDAACVIRHDGAFRPPPPRPQHRLSGV